MPDYSTHIYAILSAGLFWLACLTFLIGLLLVVMPGRLIALNERLSRWIDTSAWFRKLDEPRHLERLFYRYHVITGALIVAGSLYSLWFLWRLQGQELLVLLPALQNRVLLEIVEATVSSLFLIGNLLALVVGIVVVVRPSLLKSLEARANRWIDTESIFSKLDRRVDVTERFMPGNPRLFGLLIMIGSLYILSNTMIVVFPG